MNICEINGGITAAAGFKAAGMHCGLRKNKNKYDLAVIIADKVCDAAGVFTTNKVYAAPVGVTRAHLENGKAQAAICNSGNANTCNSDGYDKAEAECRAMAEALGISADDVIVCSTGVIGVPLPLEPIIGGIPVITENATSDASGSEAAALAIMTTDTKKKEFAFEYEYEGEKIHLGGICKGSGMIRPNMATMIGFITTDANIESGLLRKALRAAITDSFNMVSVDRDTSTNDTVTIMASGCATEKRITEENGAYNAFCEALFTLCVRMAKAIAADGEGATKLLECNVVNFADKDGARRLAKSVIESCLVKAAMFGADANWGRILCALGYAGVDIDTDKIDVSFRSSAGSILVCRNGRGVDFSEEKAKEILIRRHIFIDVDMNSGEESATAWGCDLSYEYVRINGDYRS